MEPGERSIIPEGMMRFGTIGGPGRWQIMQAILHPLRARPRNGWKDPHDQIGLLYFNGSVNEDVIGSFSVYGRLKDITPLDNQRTKFNITVSIEVVADLPNDPFDVIFESYAINTHFSNTLVPKDLGIAKFRVYEVGDLVVDIDQSRIAFVIEPFNCLASTVIRYLDASQEYISPARLRFATEKELERAIAELDPKKFKPDFNFKKTERGLAISYS